MVFKRNTLAFLMGLSLFILGDSAQAFPGEHSLNPGVFDLAITSLHKHCKPGIEYKLSEVSYVEYEIDQGQWDAVYSLKFYALDTWAKPIGKVNIDIVKFFQQNPRVSPLALREITSTQGLCSLLPDSL